MRRYLMRRNLVNVSVLIISFACSLFMAELVTRSVLDPVDYLNPTLVTDELLNHRIDGHTDGHDAWGFRNLEVPKIATTKERVYGRYMERSNFIQGHAALREAVRHEDVVRDAITVKAFYMSKILMVDLLPALEAEVEQRDPFPLTDPHPSRVGYRVIAETINRYLNNVPRATAQSGSLPAERRPSTSGASASSEEQK
jgi:hypothetical protein